MLHKKTIHLNKTTLICLLLYVIVIVSCRGYRFYLPQQYQYINMQIFGFFSVVSLIYFFILFKRIKKVDNYINKYMIILAGGFVIPQFLYTHSRYNQSLSAFYSAAQHYFFLIWIIPLFYLLLNSNSEKVLDTIANITVIGYISLIINAFMNNHFGFMLLKISGDALAQKNGYIRIVDCAVFTPLVIAYLFSNSVVHNRKLDFFKMCIVLLGQIYVEKTRMGTIALLFMLIAMLLFSKKNKFSKILTWIFLILGGFFSIAGGMIDQILSKFSIQNNGNSTLYRLNEIQFYMSHFIENKLLGIGIISPEKIMNEYGIAYWQNHNYEDIGIIGFLGIAGIVGIIVIYIIPIMRMLFVLQSVKGKISSYSEYLMLIGMFCYIIVTSATLIIVNYQRMPCFAICIALFEYIYVSCNKLEMKGIHKCY